MSLRLQTPEVAKRLKSGEWQAEEQAKNVLAQGPAGYFLSGWSQTRYRSDISSAFPPRSSLPLKTPSCGMFLASLSAPPLTRFVCNPAEFALISAKGFRSNSMSETACCCQRNAVSLLDNRCVAVCAFTAFYLMNVDHGTMIRYYSLNDSVTDARYSDWRPFCSFPKESFWLYQRIGSKDDNNSEQWRKYHSKRRISQSP